MNQLTYAFISLIFCCLLLIGCNNNSSLAQKHAKRFCKCSKQFSKIDIQLKSGKIDQATHDRITAEHNACMGDENPLEALKDKPQELIQFEAEFLTELEKQCPDIARNWLSKN